MKRGNGETEGLRMASLRSPFRRLADSSLCSLSFVDELPKPWASFEFLFVAKWQLRTKQKIANRVFVQDAVNEYAFGASLEVDTVIVGSVPVQTFALPLDHAKRLRVEAIQVFGQKLELRQELQLEFLRDR